MSLLALAAPTTLALAADSEPPEDGEELQIVLGPQPPCRLELGRYVLVRLEDNALDDDWPFNGLSKIQAHRALTRHGVPDGDSWWIKLRRVWVDTPSGPTWWHSGGPRLHLAASHIVFCDNGRVEEVAKTTTVSSAFVPSSLHLTITPKWDIKMDWVLVVPSRGSSVQGGPRKGEIVVMAEVYGNPGSAS